MKPRREIIRDAVNSKRTMIGKTNAQSKRRARVPAKTRVINDPGMHSRTCNGSNGGERRESGRGRREGWQRLKVSPSRRTVAQGVRGILGRPRLRQRFLLRGGKSGNVFISGRGSFLGDEHARTKLTQKRYWTLIWTFFLNPDVRYKGRSECAMGAV